MNAAAELPAFRIQPVPVSRWRETLDKIFRHHSAEDSLAVLESTIDALRDGQLPASGLLEATTTKGPDDSNSSDPSPSTIGAIFGYPMPGRQAIVYPALLRPGINPAVGAALHETLDRWLVEAHCVLSQVIIGLRDPQCEQLLSRQNFNYLTEIVFMDIVPTRSVSLPVDSAIELVPLNLRSESDLEQIVQSTYLGSLDCPGMDGLRALPDILTGYRSTGRHSDEHWFLVECQAAAIGCVLLTAHPHDQWELIYMGVVPLARGRQYGRSITRLALDFCAQQQARQLFLAVDIQNAPARRIYAELGFSESFRRHVYVKHYH